MIYHLLSNGDRSVIVPETEAKDFLSHGYTPRSEKPVAAPDWLHAKALFGFELSPLQRSMLNAPTQTRVHLARQHDYREVA